MIKFEEFTPGDNDVNFSDGATKWSLVKTETGSYLLKEYDETSTGFLWKTCYQPGSQPQSLTWMCYHMPTDKEAFKRKAKRLLKKIARLG